MTHNTLGLVPTALADLQLVSISEALCVLRIGRTHFYKLVETGKIAPVKLGRRTLIRASELTAFINALQPIGGVQ